MDVKNNRIWFPIHEAGHIVSAMSFRLLHTYCILDYASGPFGRGVTEPPPNTAMTSKQHSIIIGAGFAAEQLLYKEMRTNGQFDEDFFIAAMSRSSDDLSKFFYTVREIRNSTGNLVPISTLQERADALQDYATHHIKPVIAENQQKFNRVRSHFSIHGFIGQSSLIRIQADLIPDTGTLAEDRLQLPPSDPAWRVQPPGHQLS